MEEHSPDPRRPGSGIPAAIVLCTLSPDEFAALRASFFYGETPPAQEDPAVTVLLDKLALAMGDTFEGCELVISAQPASSPQIPNRSDQP